VATLVASLSASRLAAEAARQAAATLDGARRAELRAVKAEKEALHRELREKLWADAVPTLAALLALDEALYALTDRRTGDLPPWALTEPPPG
jgi:hypothetical protein